MLIDVKASKKKIDKFSSVSIFFRFLFDCVTNFKSCGLFGKNDVLRLAWEIKLINLRYMSNTKFARQKRMEFYRVMVSSALQAQQTIKYLYHSILRNLLLLPM